MATAKDILKLVLINPMTLWLRWLLIKFTYQSKFSGKHLSVKYMAHISRSNFGNYNVVYEYAELVDVELGDYSYIASRSRLSKVSIGKFSCMGPEVIVGLGMHPARDFVTTHPAFFSPSCQAGFTFSSQAAFQEFANSKIGNDVWIGARAIILDGISIGDGAIIAAGAVVTKDVPPYAVMGGVPAKVLRYRFEPSEIDYLLTFRWWDKDFAWLNENHTRFHNVKDFCKPNFKPK